MYLLNWRSSLQNVWRMPLFALLNRAFQTSLALLDLNIYLFIYSAVLFATYNSTGHILVPYYTVVCVVIYLRCDDKCTCCVIVKYFDTSEIQQLISSY